MATPPGYETFAKWLTYLSAKQGQEPTPQPLLSDAWHRIGANLRSASTRFGQVAKAIDDPSQPAAQIAQSLERQARVLADHARQYERRAKKPKPTHHEAESKLKAEPEKTKNELPNSEARLQEETKVDKADTETEPESKPVSGDDSQGTEPGQTRKQPPTPAQLVKKAVDTLETAREKFDAVEHLDAVASDFEARIDLLEELALSLQQKCELLEGNDRKP
jgi:hypothetical protein